MIELLTFAKAINKLEDEGGAIFQYGRSYPIYEIENGNVHKIESWWAPTYFATSNSCSFSPVYHGEAPPLFTASQTRSEDWVCWTPEEWAVEKAKRQEARKKQQEEEMKWAEEQQKVYNTANNVVTSCPPLANNVVTPWQQRFEAVYGVWKNWHWSN